MNRTKHLNTPKVIVLAGLFDPCGDIGTQLRYLLLPVPWTRAEFEQNVSILIKCELQQKINLERQSKLPPLDPDDAKLLAANIGIRAWVKEIPKNYKLSKDKINHLSFNVHSANFEWQNSNPNDENIIRNFNLFLLNLL
jgi:hypothetical protein